MRNRRIKGPNKKRLSVWSRPFKMTATIADRPGVWEETLWATAASPGEAESLMQRLIDKHVSGSITVEPIGKMVASKEPPRSPRPHVYGQVIMVHDLNEGTNKISDKSA